MRLTRFVCGLCGYVVEWIDPDAVLAHRCPKRTRRPKWNPLKKEEQ